MANPTHADVTPHNILLIKLRHHGDMLLTTPVVNALRQRLCPGQYLCAAL
ncbi:putative lipopolysaccharide heptosyltransferase III|nr:putative lipopolysaccharide heptosyltransferase III [Candidatus Pantoea persica]